MDAATLERCPVRRSPTARTSATSRSSRTSTTARPRSSTPCSGSPAPSGRTRTWPSASWTPTTSSARRASPSSPRTRPSASARPRSTSSTRPGHADFGGEVERALTHGRRRPAARRRLRGAAAADALRAPQGARGRAAADRRRSTRSTAPTRAKEVLDEIYELFIDLDAERGADRLPDRLHGRARGPRRPHARRPRADLRPLFDTLLETIPPPASIPAHPLQALVTNLDYQRLRRPARAPPHPARDAPQGSADRLVPRGRHDLERARRPSCSSSRRSTASPPTRPAPATSSRSRAIDDVTIGETIADPDDPRPLPVSTVDEPSLSVTFGINTSPLAGTEGDY